MTSPPPLRRSSVRPQNVKIENIASMNRDYLKAAITCREEAKVAGTG